MQLEQQFDLALPPAAVWPAFGDIALMVGCLPGAALAGDEADGQWPLRFDIKLGPVVASFGGQGRLTRDEATHSGRFEGQASDRKTGSRVKGAAAFALAAAGSGTRVTVSVDYTLTGAARAGGARRHREGTGRGADRAVRGQPAAAPGDRRTGRADRDSVAAPATPEPLEAAALGDMAPLSAGALLWQALRRWLGRLFSHRRSTP